MTDLPAVPPPQPARPAVLVPWLLLLLAVALPLRITMTREPLNSDDHHTRLAARAWLAGTHPLQQRLEPHQRVSHHLLRIGYVLPVAAAMKVFGDGALAYYTVPFAFSMLAIAATFLVLQRFVGMLPAFLAGLVQVLNPLEVVWASLLLSNMASAALSVTFVLALLAATDWRPGTRLRNVLAGVAAGLAIGWVFLIRNSDIVTMAPVFGIGLLARRYRRPVLVSLLVLGAIIVGEQLLYVWRGAELGYRVHNMAVALREYRASYYVAHSFGEYLMRYPRRAFELTGSRAVEGIFLAAIACHAYAVVFSRNWMFRALLLSGLLTLAIQTFTLFAPLSEGYVCMPAMMRFVQLFLLTGVMAVTFTLWHTGRWTLGVLYARLAQGRAATRPGAWRLGRTLGGAALAIALAALLARPLAAGTRRLPGRPLLSLDGQYAAVLMRINAVMVDNRLRSVEVIGTDRGVAGIGIFRNLPPGREVRYTPLPVAECIRRIEAGTCDLFLVDLYRERDLVQYLPDPQLRRQRSDELHRVESLARERLVPLYSSARFLLARAEHLGPRHTAADPPVSRAGSVPIARDDLAFGAADGSAPHPAWQHPDRPDWDVFAAEGGGAEIRCRFAGSDAAYLHQDAGGFDRPPITARPVEGGATYELRLPATILEGQPRAMLWVIEYDAQRRLRHHTLDLADGVNRLEFATLPETLSVRIAIRFSGEGILRLQPMELLKHRDR